MKCSAFLCKKSERKDGKTYADHRNRKPEGRRGQNVFECAIDALSYLTQVKMQGADWRQESVLSLGGVYKSTPNEVSKVPVALQGYLNAHADVCEMVLRLDNDAVGRGATGAISQAITNLPVSVELPADGKDYNGLIKVGGALVPFINQFPRGTALYRLMTTKPGESL